MNDDHDYNKPCKFDDNEWHNRLPTPGQPFIPHAAWTPVTTTDADLRDLLQHAGMSAEEIEQHLANPYATAYAKSLLDAIHKLIAKQMAQRLIEKIFDGDDEFAVELRRRLFDAPS